MQPALHTSAKLSLPTGLPGMQSGLTHLSTLANGLPHRHPGLVHFKPCIPALQVDIANPLEELEGGPKSKGTSSNPHSGEGRQNLEHVSGKQVLHPQPRNLPLPSGLYTHCWGP